MGTTSEDRVTELGEFARRKEEFTTRNTKLVGVSVDPVESHRRWDADIAETQGHGLNYPLIGDADRTVAKLYGMIHPNASDTTTVRTVSLSWVNATIGICRTHHPSAVGTNFPRRAKAR